MFLGPDAKRHMFPQCGAAAVSGWLSAWLCFRRQGGGSCILSVCVCVSEAESVMCVSAGCVSVSEV